jgi:hypothetical protein
MSDLQNLTPANTYKGLLQIGDYTDGISGDTGGNALQVTDGAGNNTALAISTDRVGIGTTSPSQELDVNGNVVADEYALDQTGSSSSAVAIHAPTTNELAIRTNSTEAMRIDSNGNVGIGTASPDEMLHLEGAEPVIKLTDTTTNLSASLDANNTRGSLLCIADSTNDGTDAFISFRIGGRAIEYQKMIIDSDGNVGIGTTDPDGLLELYKASGSDGYNHLRLITGAGGGLSIGALSDDANPTWVINTNSGEPLVFSSATNEYMRIDSGNVGIGTTDPDTLLDVNGVASFRVPTGGKTIISWGIGDNTSVNQPAFLLRTNETNDEDRVKLNSDGDSWFNGGKLGIGTMTPSAPLEVSSTTGGVIMPRMNTSQRTAISASNGEMVYDTDLHKFYGYANGAWVALH